MKIRILIVGIVIIVGIVFGAVSFIETKIEYADFYQAKTTGRKMQIKGTWLREKESKYNVDNNEYIFFMIDDNGHQTKVIYSGIRPINFELADAIVVKGMFKGEDFYASEILTKCPSKYDVSSNTFRDQE